MKFTSSPNFSPKNAGKELMPTFLRPDLVEALVRAATILGYTQAADFADQMADKVGEYKLGDGTILHHFAQALRDTLADLHQGSGIAKGAAKD